MGQVLAHKTSPTIDYELVELAEPRCASIAHQDEDSRRRHHHQLATWPLYPVRSQLTFSTKRASK